MLVIDSLKQDEAANRKDSLPCRSLLTTSQFQRRVDLICISVSRRQAGRKSLSSLDELADLFPEILIGTIVVLTMQDSVARRIL